MSNADPATRETTLHVVVPVRAGAGIAAHLCADFGLVHSWHPAFSACVVDGDGAGAVRTLDMGGSPVLERLEQVNEDGRGYAYSVLQHPLVPVGARGSIVVRAGDSEDESVLEWTLSFDPSSGFLPPNAVVELVRGLAAMGLEAAKAVLEDSAPADWPEDEVTTRDARPGDVEL